MDYGAKKSNRNHEYFSVGSYKHPPQNRTPPYIRRPPQIEGQFQAKIFEKCPIGVGKFFTKKSAICDIVIEGHAFLFWGGGVYYILP